MSKYISHGTYGCVMRPNAPCSTATGPDKNMVSKLFRVNKEAISENAMHKNVHAIDPQGVFTLRLHDMCKVPPHIFPDLNKCSNWSKVEKQRDKIEQIIYEYGGTSLYIAAKTVEPSILFRQFKSLFKGLIIMQERNWSHLDIKPDNIVYNADTKKMTLIDFGLTTKLTDVYTTKNNYLHEYEYPYYPPEFKFVMPHTIREYLTGRYKVMKWSKNLLASVNRLDSWEGKAREYYDEIYKIKMMPPPGYFIAEKVDVFSLGVAMLEALVVACGTFKFDKDLRGKLVDLISGMIELSSKKRYSPREAYAAFKKVWDQDTVTSPKRSIPVPITIKKVASPKPKSPTPKPKPASRPKAKKYKVAVDPIPKPKVVDPKPAPVAAKPKVKKIKVTAVATTKVVKPKKEKVKQPCPEGKIRNPITGRCILKSSSRRPPCPDGKVRNPLTGRCIKKKSSKKPPCPDGKIRNPLTGRCKKITL